MTCPCRSTSGFPWISRFTWWPTSSLRKQETEKAVSCLTHGVPEMEVVESQTDEFLPEAPAEQYEPQRTRSRPRGISMTGPGSTPTRRWRTVMTDLRQLCPECQDGELFDFDWEVEPILDVLVP